MSLVSRKGVLAIAAVIDVALTANPIFGVDTAEHLEKARALLAH